MSIIEETLRRLDEDKKKNSAGSGGEESLRPYATGGAPASSQRKKGFIRPLLLIGLFAVGAWAGADWYRKGSEMEPALKAEGNLEKPPIESETASAPLQNSSAAYTDKIRDARLEESARKAREMRLAEEKRMAEETRAAEARRLEAEAKVAEAEKLARERIAEAERIAEEMRLKTEASIAKQRKTAGEARIAEQNKLALEAQKVAEAKIAEANRIAEERIAEAKRLGEESRLAEEKRLKAEAKIAEANRIAELKRLEAEKKALEVERLAEEKRLAAAKLVAAQNRKEAEAKLAEANRIADERIKEANRIAEEARLAVKARLAEADRISKANITAAQKKEAMMAQKAAEAKLAEANRIAEAKIAEANRLAAEAQAAAEARILEAEKIAKSSLIAAKQKEDETARLEAQAAALEARRIKAEERLAQAKKEAEEKKIAARAKAAEANKAREEKRLAEAMRVAEEKKSAAEASLAEAERLVAKAEADASMASLPAAAVSRSVSNPAKAGAAKPSSKPSFPSVAEEPWIKEGWQIMGQYGVDAAMGIWRRGLRDLPDEQLVWVVVVYENLDRAAKMMATKIGPGKAVFLVEGKYNGNTAFYVLSAPPPEKLEEVRSVILEVLDMNVMRGNFQKKLLKKMDREVKAGEVLKIVGSEGSKEYKAALAERKKKEATASDKKKAEPEAPKYESVQARIEGAREFLKSGSYIDAIEALNPVFKTNEGTWEAYFLIGSAYLGLGELEKAEDYLDNGLAIDSKRPQLWLQRAIVQQQQGKHEKALDTLHRLEKLDSSIPMVQLNIGYSNDTIGRRADAETAYRKFLQLTENNPQYRDVRARVIKRLMN